jgi:16S rRNA (uracil1498-N3)-methyltransferase
MTSLKRISEVIFSNVPKEKISMIIPLIKKENLHFMVQKLTEIGISEFIFYKPDLIDQSIAKKDHHKMIEKCLEVVISSCKQCGSNFIPQLNLFENIIDAFDSIKTKTDSFLFDLDAKNPFNIEELSYESNVCLITGPESGFSDSELKLLNKRNIKIRLIGKNTLRAETAPLVVASLVQNQFGNI